jgi:hypothetical protein
MANDNAREKLLYLIDRKAFEPVLSASPKDYQSDKDRQKLTDAQKTTRSTQHRYHTSYKTAQDVYQNYKDDLSSDAAEDVDRELKALRLPTLRDIKPEVEKLAGQLGVK